jgi:mono/diheme cytochrome c family protein
MGFDEGGTMRAAILGLLAMGCGEVVPCEGLDFDADGVCDAEAVDWSADAQIPPGGRPNLYGYDDATLAEAYQAGMQLAYAWPNPNTGLLVPFRPIDVFLEDPGNAAASSLVRTTLGFGSYDEFYDWMGLARFPAEPVPGLPTPEGQAPGDPVGATVIDTPHGEGLTFSCATCHTSTVFGRPVLGLSNRRVRANAIFSLAADIAGDLSPAMFQQIFDATDEETALFARNQTSLEAVGAKKPAVLGLDSAVAQVGLSLGKRADDAHASFSSEAEAAPAFSELETLVAESKPPVWWNLRYKTRWSVDGNQVSGNPTVYSIVANELGRGTDLVDLRAWFEDNRAEVELFTAAMFAVEAPRWVDWFGPDSLDLEAAQAGEALYGEHCADCHGTYTKDWTDGSTVELAYHPNTPSLDVGTDPQRRDAAERLHGRLNQLAIHTDSGSTFERVEGYVPPPLDGIWARYPYLHNNAVPTLCDLLRPPEERPDSFVQGPAGDPSTDFDADCVGYPTGDAIPASWLDDEEAGFDTTVPGLSNQGHDAMLRDAGGAWVLSDADRAALVAFLKTL